MKRHPILVVGCGSIGERHTRCFLKTERADVAACDANAPLLERIAATYRVRAFSDWEEAMRSGGFAAVVICTPAQLHVQMARHALRCGLHVLVEKPLSQSPDGVRDLLQAPERQKLQTAVGYTLHSSPLLRAAGDYLRSGKLGGIRQVTVRAGQPFDHFRPAYAQTYYRRRETGGGAIQDALTHAVNWVESIVGAADSLYCDCAHQVLPAVEVEDTVHIASRHRGVMVNFTLNQFQCPCEMTLQFDGTQGSLKIEDFTSRWGVMHTKIGEWAWHSVPPGERDTDYTTQAHAFLDQIEGKPSRLCSLEAAADTLRFNLTALASAEQGRKLDLLPLR